MIATGANNASVALELQADCLAGVWSHAASQSGRFKAGHVELEPGDAERALRAAATTGDDQLQKMGSDARNPATEGVTLWVRKNPSRSSSPSMDF